MFCCGAGTQRAQCFMLAEACFGAGVRRARCCAPWHVYEVFWVVATVRDFLLNSRFGQCFEWLGAGS
eukprot:3471468-Alexandrium_andersonii.AAC.1